jgi:hypothetical protein
MDGWMSAGRRGREPDRLLPKSDSVREKAHLTLCTCDLTTRSYRDRTANLVLFL